MILEKRIKSQGVSEYIIYILKMATKAFTKIKKKLLFTYFLMNLAMHT